MVLGATAARAEESSGRFYQAVRNNDVASLRALLKTSYANLRDKRGATPLMYAAAFGSLDAMKLLLAAGADVNAKNAFDAGADVVRHRFGKSPPAGGVGQAVSPCGPHGAAFPAPASGYADPVDGPFPFPLPACHTSFPNSLDAAP